MTATENIKRLVERSAAQREASRKCFEILLELAKEHDVELACDAADYTQKLFAEGSGQRLKALDEQIKRDFASWRKLREWNTAASRVEMKSQ